MSQFVIKSMGEVNRVAREFLAAFPDPAVFAFYGSMGVGKTTFVKAICDELDVLDIVNSPSFAIVNEYSYPKGEAIYHFDFYRLKELEEALDLGYEEYVDSGCYCFIEWPEKIENILPEKRFDVHIRVDENDFRIIEVVQKGV